MRKQDLSLEQGKQDVLTGENSSGRGWYWEYSITLLPFCSNVCGKKNSQYKYVKCNTLGKTCL